MTVNINHPNPSGCESNPQLPTPDFPSSAKTSEPTETLLVVDNDRAVLNLEAMVLRRGGHLNASVPLPRPTPMCWE